MYRSGPMTGGHVVLILSVCVNYVSVRACVHECMHDWTIYPKGNAHFQLDIGIQFEIGILLESNSKLESL